MATLPKISNPVVIPELLEGAQKMEGRTIKSVEYGYREQTRDVHGSEVLILNFTDGTTLGVVAGSNAMELKGKPLKPDKLLIDFMLRWSDE